MQTRFNIRRLLKRLLITAVVIILVCVIVVLVAKHVLSARGVSYERLAFQFPSTLTVQGLQFKNSSIDASAGTVRAHWSWRGLFRGDIISNSIFVGDAAIRIRTGTDDTDTTGTAPLIDIRRADINNVRLIWRTETDSSIVWLRNVLATGVKYDGTIVVDSLINRDSEFIGVYVAPKPASVSQDTVKDTSGTFSIQSIPVFSVRYFEFDNCDFAIRYGEHNYAVNKFDLQFSGLNNHDMMDMTLHRLAFRYQDSVDVDLSLHNASVDKQNKARIKNVFLELPGLRFDAPELMLSNRDGFGVSASLDSTYIDTDLLNFVFPSLRKWIPEGSRVTIDGNVDYRTGEVSFQKSTLLLGKDGTLSASGRLQFGDGDSLGLNVHKIESSLFGLSKWGGFPIPDGQRDFPVKGQIAIEGTYAHFKSSGQLRVHETDLRYRGSVNQTAQGTLVEFGVESPYVEPRQVITSFKNDFRLVGLSLKGSVTLGNNKLSMVNGEVNSDSVFTGKQWIESPAIVASYSHTHSVVALTSKHGTYEAKVNIKGDALSGEEINCSGSLRFRVLQAGAIGIYSGHMFTHFSGSVRPGDPAAKLVFDTLQFRTQDNKLYTTKGLLEAARLPDQSFKATLAVDEYATLNALVGADVMDWLNSEDKLLQFPTATISMSLHADTTLVKAITGIPAFIEVEKLNIISTKDNIDLSFSSDTLYWQDFHSHRIEGSVSYHPGYLSCKIETPEVITPLTLFDSVKFEVATHRDSAFTVSLNTYLPEIDRGLGLSYRIASLRDGYRISFGDSVLLLGINRWKTNQSGSLFVNRSFDEFSGELGIRHRAQTAILSGRGKELLWRLEGLDLFPITQSIAADPPIHGIINAAVSSNFKEKIFKWDGSLKGTSIDTVTFGDLSFRGSMTDDSLSVSGQLVSKEYNVVGLMSKPKSEDAHFKIKVDNVNLRKFSSLLPVPSSTLTVDGILNADVEGSYGEKLKMKGYVTLPNTEIISKEYDFFLKSDQDSLVLDGATATLKGFVFRDRYSNPLTIRGTANLPSQSMDFTIKSDRFRILDRTQKKATLSGEVDLTCDVRVRGQKGNYKVSGRIGTHDGATLTYLYKNTVSLDDRQREMEFVSFTQEEEAVRERPKRRRPKKPLDWDVTFEVGKIDVNVLFSAVNQDHINTTASGKVAFTTGSSAEPSAYGLIESNSGNIVYHVPMMSDLRMIILKAGVRWVGDVGKPLLSFNGSQTFRITPNEISSLFTNKTDKWPISVIAKVNDRALNDLVLDFDLSSTNNQVTDWISTLAPETREAYAVSLLLRGRINTGGTADVNLLTQTMVSKMNEISSRNIKSADVSFYDESRGPNSPDGSSNKIGYSITKGLANKKMRIIVGGSVDLTGKADPSMTDVKVEYVLREDPTVTLRAGKANVYTGVIDGNVDESSFGFTYIKRFRNLFNSHKKRSKE
ncbi:MAG: translocation/assembly module TamB domain-containing protein [Chryseolinea sp.]